MIRRLSLATALTLSLVSAIPGWADGLAGSYLAARHAGATSDFVSASQYYTKALVLDPTNPQLMEGALLSQVGLGAMDRAIPIARRLKEIGADSQFADLVLLADELQRKAYGEARDNFKAGRQIGPLVDGLVTAWSELGDGKMTEALAAFDAAGQGAGLQAYGLYHKALAMASAGDFEGADAIMAGGPSGKIMLNRRGMVAHIEVLSQLERNPDAIALIDQNFDTTIDPGMKALRDRLAAGEVLPFDIVRDASDGLAEVFLTVAAALNGDAEDGYTLIYARISEFLRPGNADAVLLSADLLAAQKQYDLAAQTYNQIPQDDAAYVPSEMGRADMLYRSGKKDAAVEVMEQLAKTQASSSVVQVTLGDMLRREERYGDAVVAYDRAIALLGDPKPGHWVVYYSRGIAQERTGHMDLAEADMRLALTLSPDQPQVLNYLGYAFVDAGRNLDEALGMIQRAVAARPDDGYIIDSLGWALYRMGRAEEAVAPMEQAAMIEAVDPVVNDHLGDVYWVVGRKLEAQFQWRRALSFDPAPEDRTRIERKIAVGLDTVLKEEGAAPPAVTADGN